MKNAFKSLLLVVTMLMAGTVAFAQVTTASLGGRIVDTKGETIIGAAVVATHTPSGTTYGAVTNGEGLYAIQGMRTGGPYVVEVSCLGYQTVKFTDIKLALTRFRRLRKNRISSNWPAMWAKGLFDRWKR